jgi:hypothetical protein
MFWRYPVGQALNSSFHGALGRHPDPVPALVSTCETGHTRQIPAGNVADCLRSIGGSMRP